MTSLDPSHNPFKSSAQAVHRPATEGEKAFPDSLPTVSRSSDRKRRGRSGAKDEGRERVRQAMPPMPDLRFEQSYLVSIRPFLTPRPTQKAVAEKGTVAPSSGSAAPEGESKTLVSGAEEDAVFHWGREVQVDWAKVGWVTVRDQMLSPLIQGALWGWLTVFLATSGAVLRASLYPTSHVRQGRIAGGPGGVKATASGGEVVGETGWWKKWVGSWFGAVETAVV